MKKNNILLVRIVTLCAIMLLELLLFVFAVKGSLFDNIIRHLNYNAAMDYANLNNLYFYMGLGIAYKILFSINVISIVTAVISVLLRYRNAGTISKTANISVLITGVFLLFARFMESSKPFHKFIDKFYMGASVSNDFVTAQLLERIPIVYILIVILSVLGLLVVKSSNISKLKSYNNENKDVYPLMVIGIIGTVFANVIRNVIVYVLANGMSEQVQSANMLLNDFCINDLFILRQPMCIFIAVAVILMLVLYNRLDKRIYGVVSVVIPAVIVTAAMMIAMFNPPALFGYLTFDEKICDITEQAYNGYILMNIIAAITIIAGMFFAFVREIKAKKCLMICLINAIASIILIIISSFAGNIAVMYYSCIAVDLFTFGYVAYIGIRHH